MAAPLHWAPHLGASACSCLSDSDNEAHLTVGSCVRPAPNYHAIQDKLNLSTVSDSMSHSAPRTAIGRCIGLFAILAIESSQLCAQLSDSWDLAVASALLEEFRGDEVVERDVVRLVSLYVNKRTGAISACLAAARSGCKSISQGQPNLRDRGRFKLVSVPRSANPQAVANAAMFMVLDTLTSQTDLCVVTSFDAKTESPRHAACTSVKN